MTEEMRPPPEPTLEEQAEPLETHMPLASRYVTRLSPSIPLNETFTLLQSL